MSFNDVPRSRGSVRSSGGPSTLNKLNFVPGGDALTQLSESLTALQRNCILIKERIADMRRRKVGPAEKTDLDSSIKDVRDFEGRLKMKLDSESKSLEIQPRTEIAQKRLALAKLQKDYERIKVLISSLSSESALIKVDNSVSTSMGKSSNSSRTFDSDAGNSSQNNMHGKQNQSGQQLQSQLLIQEVDIDSLIIEERERDIKKLTNDIKLVNEMFKDMADIVHKQGDLIEEVATTTDSAHERAQAGLEEVKKAADHQRACIIS